MNAPKVRIRRRHLPTGTVVETHERAAVEPTTLPEPTNQRTYAPTTIYQYRNGGYQAVSRP